MAGKGKVRDKMRAEDLLKAPDLMESNRILIVQPHPDDNEIGMGAIIAKLTASGKQVIYLTVTNGDMGSNDEALSPTDVAMIRKRETEEAGKHLGVNQFHFLNLPDGGPHSHYDMTVMIAGIIRKVKPDTVICPDPWLPYEGHGDHREIGLAVAQAVLMAGHRSFPRGTECTPFAPENIGFYFTSVPNQIIDVSETLEKKFEAISLHRTQVDENTMSLFRLYFTQKAVSLAQDKPFMFGEGVKMLRRIHLHCFVDACRV